MVSRTSPLSPEGFLVNQEDVRIEDLGRVAHDRTAHLHGLFRVEQQVERCVLAVAQLDDTGNAHEVHPRTKVEASDDGGARKNQGGQIVDGAHHGMGDGAAPAQMSQSETVMAVDQDARAFRKLIHDLSRHRANRALIMPQTPLCQQSGQNLPAVFPSRAKRS